MYTSTTQNLHSDFFSGEEETLQATFNDKKRCAFLRVFKH